MSPEIESTKKPSPSTTAATSPASAPGSAVASVDALGSTVIADVVVSKIAGIATREVGGVHDVGGNATRVVGVLREKIPGARTNVTQGVSVEVGERRAVVDINLVAEYGVAIHELAEVVRQNVISAVEGMTGLEVSEVNVAVTDVHLPDESTDDPADTGDTPNESRPRIR